MRPLPEEETPETLARLRAEIYQVALEREREKMLERLRRPGTPVPTVTELALSLIHI